MSQWPPPDSTVEELRRVLGVGHDPGSTVVRADPYEKPRGDGYFLRVNAPDDVETGYCERGHEFGVVRSRSEHDALWQLLRELRPRAAATRTGQGRRPVVVAPWRPTRRQRVLGALTLVCGLLLLARAIAWLVLPWLR